MPVSNGRAGRVVSAALLPAMLLAAPAHSAAAAVGDPSALVTDVGGQLRQIFGDEQLSPLDRQQRFRGLLDEDFDFPTISRFVLGRFWQGTSDSFRREFSSVFEDYVVQSLIAGFANYGGKSMNVTATRAEGEHGAIVSTTVVRADGGPSAKLEWQVRETPNGLKIADVSVSGVSMALSYREQFAAAVDHDGGQVSALIPDLRHKLDKAASNAAVGSDRANAGTR
jgi:phospholipid transport system substrate-binding protein